ncbi:hypothetical protein EDD21DRAFT_380920 [Dissophora ornata]|nr:hypothetical protein EDD21DRAFT_380920 [Dissophora ornata]
MVVALGDKVQILAFEKYVGNRKLVKWSQNLSQRAVEFVFMPFTCLRDNTHGFIAVEFGRFNDFQKQCREIPADPDDWANIYPSREFIVTNEFKYGQNNEQTFRFLVFLDSSYKPLQHQFTSLAEGDEGMTDLGSLVKKHGGYADIGGILSITKSFVGDDLHTF